MNFFLRIPLDRRMNVNIRAAVVDIPQTQAW